MAKTLQASLTRVPGRYRSKKRRWNPRAGSSISKSMRRNEQEKPFTTLSTCVSKILAYITGPSWEPGLTTTLKPISRSPGNKERDEPQSHKDTKICLFVPLWLVPLLSTHVGRSAVDRY